MSPPARVLLVDDHQFVLEAWGSRLARCPDVQVIGCATSGEAAREAAEALHPDAILLDLRLPGREGLETLRALKQACPATAIIMLTVSDRESDLLECIAAGASGYLMKDCSFQLLRQTIRSARLGSSSVPRDLLRKAFARSSRTWLSPGAAPGTLSEREMQVLQLIVNGYSTREIGTELRIATGTIKKHIHHILLKLGVSDRTQAMLTALRLGIARMA